MVSNLKYFPLDTFKVKMNELKWHQVVIIDQDQLPGKNLVKLINLINPFLNCNYVIMDFLYGAIPTELMQMQLKIQDLTSVLSLLENTAQVESGDFFLFKKRPSNWQNKSDYPFVIKKLMFL